MGGEPRALGAKRLLDDLDDDLLAFAQQILDLRRRRLALRLAAVAELMRPNDLLVLTTLSSLGLDIRTLWEASASVNPPHHINFLNPGAMSGLAARVGLEPVRIFTPGVLDLDIMRNNREKVQDRFWRSVIDTADGPELAEWQALVSEAGRSSHMWAVLRKPLRD